MRADVGTYLERTRPGVWGERTLIHRTKRTITPKAPELSEWRGFEGLLASTILLRAPILGVSSWDE